MAIPRVESQQRPDRHWGQHSILVKGYRDSSPGVFLPGRGVDNSPLCRTKVKNEWRHTSRDRDSFNVLFAFVWYDERSDCIGRLSCFNIKLLCEMSTDTTNV